ncbi:hypothetical protein HY251_10225 [bacterium]|nr:hypothetical protein [bacterium]
MADRVSPSALRASLSTLRGYLDDLARSSFEEQATKLRLFVNYFQKDSTVRYLADRLHVRLRDVQKQVLSSKLELPEDPIDEVAFVYEVLFLLKQGQRLDLREFLSRAFTGATIEARWDDFRARWLRSLVEGLQEIIDRIEGLLRDEPVDPEEIFALVLLAGFAEAGEDGAAAGDDDDADAASESAPRAPEASSDGASLRAAIARLPEPRRGDLETDLEILALERRKKRPSPERLLEIVSSFEAVSGELGALARAQAGLPLRESAKARSKNPKARKPAARKPSAARAKKLPSGKTAGKKRKR